MSEEKKDPTTQAEAEPSAVPVVAEKPAAPPVKAILGRKIGMTRVYDDRGRFIPVTVVQAGPCPVLSVKTAETDGYTALQLGFGGAKAKNINKPETGLFSKNGLAPTAIVREVLVAKTEGFEPGQNILVSNFSKGDVVDVSGFNKGKGFAGAVKRHRFRGGPKTHGQSDRWRAPGSSGRERVWPGKRGPGHMGHEWSTVQRLEVVQVNADENLLLLEGSVPGPNGNYVTIKQTTRPRKVKKGAPAVAAAAKKAPKAAAKPAAKAPAAPAAPPAIGTAQKPAAKK
jgi:large subunit ribosomal protein L3